MTMSRMTKRAGFLMGLVASGSLTTAALAGPVPTGTPTATATATGTPTATATATSPGTPTATPTATATASPTQVPEPTCQDLWASRVIFTLGKGQSPTNNAKLVNRVRGRIVNWQDLGATAHRIEVCRGSTVIVTFVDSTGAPELIPNSSGVACDEDGCRIQNINATEKYIARSADGKDTDRMTFLPRD